jgi:hypothetical protein
MYYGAFINKSIPGRNEHDQLWVRIFFILNKIKFIFSFKVGYGILWCWINNRFS